MRQGRQRTLAAFSLLFIHHPFFSAWCVLACVLRSYVVSSAHVKLKRTPASRIIHRHTGPPPHRHAMYETGNEKEKGRALRRDHLRVSSKRAEKMDEECAFHHVAALNPRRYSPSIFRFPPCLLVLDNKSVQDFSLSPTPSA